MKGFLKSGDGVFQLSPRMTTIGRERCDLIILAMDIDLQHAVIEFNERESTFALQDMNSVYGTFVNDVLVKDAAVPLSHGDLIRFGSPGVLFEFIIDIPKEVSPCLPLDKRPAYLAAHPIPPQIIYRDGLPQLRSPMKNLYGAEEETTSTDDTNAGFDPADEPRWIIGPGSSYKEACQVDAVLSTEQMGVSITCLRAEVKRLSAIESECMLKDDLIDQLKDEVAHLQQMLRRLEVGSREIVCHDQLGPEADINLLQLQKRQSHAEIENDKPNSEVQPPQQDSAQQLLEMTEHSSFWSNAFSGPLSFSQFSVQSPYSGDFYYDRVSRPTPGATPSAVVERLQKEISVTNGLISLMQRNLAMKDETIEKLSTEADILRSQMDDKDCEIEALTESILNSSEEIDFEEEILKKERQLLVQHYKIQNAAKRREEQNVLIASLRNELKEFEKTMEASKHFIRQLESEIEIEKVKFLDLERSERHVKIDLEQAHKRMEMFRSHLISLALSHPNVTSPDNMINDADLILALKKCFEPPPVIVEVSSILSLEDKNQKKK